MEVSKSKYLNTILFSELFFWDVKRYLSDPFAGKAGFIKLKEIIYQFKKNISKDEIINHKYQIISKINFSGKLFLRNFEEINSYRGNLFFVPQSSIIYSKINVRHGCVYFNNKASKPFTVSSEYPVFIFDTDIVSGEYLHLVLRSKPIKEYLDTRTTGISKSRIKVDEFLNLPVPLPPLEEQNRIVKVHNKKIELAKELEEKARQLDKDIETYLFDELGIIKKKKAIINDGLNFISFKDISVWGVEKLLKGTKSNILESNKYPNKVLSQVTSINPTTDISNLKDEDEMSFIPMVCVSDDYGEIIELSNGVKGNSKGYTKFKNGDLIWARITPCMQNGKSAIVENLKNGVGYGSTEYHVVRKKHKDVLINYVYHLLRSHAIRKDAISHFTGSAGQQRVPKSYLENLIIPVPPVEIQKKIISTIKQIKSEIEKLDRNAKDYREQAINDFESEIFISE